MLDLFLVLGTGPESNRRSGLQPAPHPLLLARALRALQPIRALFQAAPGGYACGTRATGQFGRWADCVNLVRSHEEKVQRRWRRLGTPGTYEYDYLFKGRPDVVFFSPIDLALLAAQLDRQTVLGGNDAHLLLHRSQWDAMQQLRSTALDCSLRLCGGRATPVLRTAFPERTGELNEYCILRAALARAGLNHLEASHPMMSRYFMPHVLKGWASSLGSHNWAFVRFDEENGYWAAGASSGGSGPVELKMPVELASLPGRLAAGSAEAPGVWWFLTEGLLGGTICHPTEQCDGGSRDFECSPCSTLPLIVERPCDYADIIGEVVVRWLLRWVFDKGDVADAGGMGCGFTREADRDGHMEAQTRVKPWKNLSVGALNVPACPRRDEGSLAHVTKDRHGHPLHTGVGNAAQRMRHQRGRAAASTHLSARGFHEAESACVMWLEAGGGDACASFAPTPATAALHDKCFSMLERVHPVRHTSLKYGQERAFEQYLERQQCTALLQDNRSLMSAFYV